VKISLTLRKRESPRCRKLAEHQSGPKKKHPQTHHNQNTQHREQRILKASKDKRQVTYKGNPIRI
jgi:hypothetical protein